MEQGSSHFKVLREAGVIAMRRAGTQHLSSLRRADLDARFPGLVAAVLGAAAGSAADGGHPRAEGSEQERSRPVASDA